MADVVVLGAGPTGLATAMMLANQGLETMVLERDEAPPEDPEKAWETWERRGVMQFRQPHLLQAGGYALLDEHLPSVIAQLEKVGAIPFNVAERLSALLPGGPAGVDFSRFGTLICRRPFIDHAFASAARATPGVEVRYGTAATELMTGPEAIGGVPHVTGVRTDTGEAHSARLVVDAAGRFTQLPSLLEAAGARRPEEHGIEIGFAYSSQYYQGPETPEFRGDLLAPVGSISVLTVPSDRDWWSVTLYHSWGDKAMRRVRDREVFERVVRSMPLHAHWVDGEPLGEVLPVASPANLTREFVVDGRPCVTGVVPVGDAWGFTNPSLGRGLTLGLRHGIDVALRVAAHLDDPARLATEWDETTRSKAAPWHAATVDFDRIRGPEIEASRRGEPDPFDPPDRDVAMFRAFASASHYDPQVLHWFAEVSSCIALPAEVFARPEAAERVLEVAGSNPPYRAPGPDRHELEGLLA
ncbi:MAG: FAD-dependent oxidoreductase [Acidimicrobiaceae bacterium]|nr:FAD-dependent oxidoreductase [Acidimicrobiaceae bacterium]